MSEVIPPKQEHLIGRAESDPSRDDPSCANIKGVGGLIHKRRVIKKRKDS